METAIERSTERHGNGNYALLVSLLEPVFEEHAKESMIDAVVSNVFVPLGSFRCRPVLVVRSFPVCHEDFRGGIRM